MRCALVPPLQNTARNGERSGMMPRDVVTVHATCLRARWQVRANGSVDTPKRGQERSCIQGESDHEADVFKDRSADFRS